MELPSVQSKHVGMHIVFKVEEVLFNEYIFSASIVLVSWPPVSVRFICTVAELFPVKNV